jgi:myosin heavy subunit
MHQKDKIAPNTPESKILSCDPILLTFGNAKTIKNDNSSRFGKLVTLVMDGHTLRIHQVILKNYFLEKSRIISQSLN